MRVLITSEYRFVQTPDQRVWTKTAFPYSYWARYLDIFDKVLVMARVNQVSSLDDDWREATGDNVTFIALPTYLGPRQFLGALKKISTQTNQALKKSDTAILSLPSPIAMIVGLLLWIKKKPYGVEVMGDPWEVLSSHGIHHPLRPVLRVLLTLGQKCLVRRAEAASYVTQKFLQKRYPSSARSYSVGVSNVELSPEHLAEGPIDFAKRPLQLPWKFICIGSLEQLYKGPDIVLQALSQLKSQGISCHLTWAGGGRFQTAMQELTNQLDLKNEVSWLGAVSGGEAIRKLLDQSDIFVLASRTEGLPRALVEAMARALPCIGTSVGGIPELLESSQLVPSENPTALANCLAAALQNPRGLGEISRSNLEKSREFLNIKLEAKRAHFLRELHKKS